MKIRKVCLDLDDTLIPNTYKYHAPILRCAMIVVRALKHRSKYPPDLLQMQLAIDQELVAEKGFSPDRFPLSWVLTYERLAALAGLPVDPKVVERLRTEASAFQRGPFRMFPGVKRALRRLAKEGRELHVITAGDEALQRRKIAEAGIADYVDSIHVTPMRKKDILASIVGDRPKEGAMVGDSKKSDIVPAIELGMTAVWLPSETWSFVNADIDETKYHRIASVTELPDLLRKIETA